MVQEAMRKAAQIVEDSEKDPQQAIAQAASLPVSIANGRVAPRANALEGIARRRKSKVSASSQRHALLASQAEADGHYCRSHDGA